MESNRYKQIGDYMSFVLFLVVYIESWISREINLIFKDLGKSDAFISAFYVNNQGKPKFVNQVLISFMGNRKSYRVVSKAGIQRLSQRISYRRNSIAHGTYIEIKKEKAEIIVNKTMD